MVSPIDADSTDNRTFTWIAEAGKHAVKAIADSNTNVRAAEVSASDGITATGHFVVEVSNLSHLNRIIDRIKKVKGVISAKRARKKDFSD